MVRIYQQLGWNNNEDVFPCKVLRPGAVNIQVCMKIYNIKKPVKEDYAINFTWIRTVKLPGQDKISMLRLET